MVTYKKTVLSPLDYSLPEEKIALYPKKKRDECKLLVYKHGQIFDDIFYNLKQYIDDSYTLIVNDTKVIKARLLHQGENEKVREIFCTSPVNGSWKQTMNKKNNVEMICQTRKWKQGTLTFSCLLSGKPFLLKAKIIRLQVGSKVVRFSWDNDITFKKVLEVLGNIPIPPYLKRWSKKSDEQDYQTEYAKNIGSVASPTSGLHFTKDTLATLRNQDVNILSLTLHINSDTFKPITASNINEHSMHGEEVFFTKTFIQSILNNTSKKVIACGTTTLRALESIYALGIKISMDNNTSIGQVEQGFFERLNLPLISFHDSLGNVLNYFERHRIDKHNFTTYLMLKPPYKLKSCEGLMTNFHQPSSTLLLLIQTLLKDDWQKIYKHALNNDYRFLSYGDASLLFKS